MKSSYNNNISYGELLSGIVFSIQPKTIIEFGILEGYSLKTFVDNTNSTVNINAYDIFDEFNGNSANKEKLKKTFSSYPNVTIDYGDFYKKHEEIKDNSIDLLHIDIANNGDVLKFALKHYINKLSENGILIFEGGSVARDNVEWMIKYNKQPINPIINQNKNYYNIKTIGYVPSITIIKKK
jgi:predicted O-methyltransferase YrrM